VSARIIENAWQHFKKATVHPQTPAIQLAEMRRVFFCGFIAAMPATVGTGTHRLLALDAEVAEFTREIEALAVLAHGPTGGSA
jgi:hypothetical protein